MASITNSQQIDLGEETGPRTVVSGLVNYIPIDQMRDKYLVAVVSNLPLFLVGFPLMTYSSATLSPPTCVA
jgi:tRNA-binding EMAP/Myf-like protein